VATVEDDLVLVDLYRGTQARGHVCGDIIGRHDGFHPLLLQQIEHCDLARSSKSILIFNTINEIELLAHLSAVCAYTRLREVGACEKRKASVGVVKKPHIVGLLKALAITLWIQCGTTSVSIVAKSWTRSHEYGGLCASKFSRLNACPRPATLGHKNTCVVCSDSSSEEKKKKKTSSLWLM
jgi:hypothetical protein